ncbi:16S ribosomal RNA methyltransferase A [Sulfodiicoccus acidiphilus]|uniref:16S ribosomal RNA methyltransferase A n=1 Tax=Sulfodiicoccus acidiphilus TaxID=1670455 RepID=UPI000F81F6C3|nr:16S ribosomal RNA methyltransferase A [Sulfodiicoccus acidiphilus]
MKARKSLSQHFLVDKRVAQIVSSFATNRPIIEVGCGEGSLSQFLHPDLCVELDERFIPYIRGFNPVLADAKSPPFLRGEVFSSLPFSISREFMKLSAASQVSRLILILQSDFVSKLLTEPTYISYIANYTFDISEKLTISPRSFRPRPKVYSTLVEMRRKREYSEELDRVLSCISRFRNKSLRRAASFCGLKSDLSRKVRSFKPREVCVLLSSLGLSCA